MTSTDWTRTEVLGVANVLAPLLYGIGLISPLTPSEGRPGLGEVVVFVAIPLLVILYTVAVVRIALIRAVLLLEAGIIVGLTVLVLRVQAGSR